MECVWMHLTFLGCSEPVLGGSADAISTSPRFNHCSPPEFPSAAVTTPNRPQPPNRRYIKDDYLQQNSFTKYDKYCPFYKSVEMMRNICTFHRLATGGAGQGCWGSLG